MKKIQLSIPTPCHENWDNMTPTQQGRFCNACAKQVVDFSEMSDTEVLNYFSQLKNDTVCGRVYPEQLNRPIASTPVKRIYWYWNYVVALLLLLAKSNNSKAQTTKGMLLPKRVDAVQLPAAVKTSPKQYIIHNRIADEHGQPIPYASIRLLNSGRGVSADENGWFTLAIDKLNCSIEVAALNYETKEVVVYNESQREIVLTRAAVLMEEVVIVASPELRGKVSCTAIAGGISVARVAKTRSLKDSLQQWISNVKPAVKVYPNPAARGTSITVSMKLNQPGNYMLQLTDAAGKQLAVKKFNTINKEHSEQLPLTNEPAGIYYVQITSEKGVKIGTASFMVQ